MEENKALNQTPILVLGILSIVLAWTGVVGIVLAAIGLSKAKAYVAAGGQLAGKAKVGKILAIVGLILSIVYIVIWVISIIAGAAATATYYSY